MEEMVLQGLVLYCIVVASAHYAAAFTMLSPTPHAMVPISRMFSCTLEARALFQKPKDLVKIVICRHECDYSWTQICLGLNGLKFGCLIPNELPYIDYICICIQCG